MSDRYKGAILSPTAPTVTPQSAGGIYTSSQQLQYQGQGVWPQAVNYPINNSLRFRSSASASLSRTPASASNRTTWTWSGWIKRGDVSTSEMTFFSAGTDGNNFTAFAWNNNNLFFQNYTSGSQVTATSTAVFRDPSAWYHVVLAIDTTQATAADRAKVYVNGVQQAGFSGASFTQNQQFWINFTYGHRIGSRQLSSADSFTDQYMGEVNFIDGSALTPSSFGTTDAYGIWQPIPYTGAYGTNGFYLPFYNSTTLGTSVTANYLIVAGGGSGQGSGFQYVYGGGGGAGGLLTGTTTLNSAANYTITVGAGGSGVSGTDSPGNNGSNSTAFGLTAIGGSGGRSALGGGGSGGGAGSYGGGNTSGTPGQGNSGGTATAYGATASGGGGGGAGAAGGNGSSGAGGAGGAGTASSISGSSVTYAGGGGGAGSSSGGAGGAGGGGAGAGAAGNGTNGTANTGGGGGAAATTSGGNQTSGAGGSGIVIVSYAGSQRYVGGTVTTSGGNTIHTFTSSGTLTVLGNDFSGNGNNWTLNNISLTAGSTYDSMIDVPTNTNSNTANYAVLNPLAMYGTNAVISNANLTSSATSTSNDRGWASTIAAPSSGKWYAEFTFTATSGDNNGGCGVMLENGTGAPGESATTVSWRDFGTLRQNASGTTYGTALSVNDVVMVAYDASLGRVWFGKQGTWFASGDPATNANPSATGITSSGRFATYHYNTVAVIQANFGQRGFTYTPPTGFLPLNTYNLPTPTILAGNQHFNAVLRNGYGSSGGTLACGFQPDWVWEKTRSAASSHTLWDSNRGIPKAIRSNETTAELNQTWLTGFVSNGLTFGTNDYGTGVTLVEWVWKANQGNNITNTQGTITSTVSANTTAGFSIVTYTGNGTGGATVGHGLGVAPSMVIVKKRSGVADWPVQHISLGPNASLRLNGTNATANEPWWNSTAPSSTVFTLGSSNTINQSGETFVAYCFSAVAGYSAFGSYTGNGSTNGPFIYTGFRPRFVMFKGSTIASNWCMLDSARNTYNLTDATLQANDSSAELTNLSDVDFLSNGIKIRDVVTNDTNVSGQTYIYMAFAENPFKIARGR